MSFSQTLMYSFELGYSVYWRICVAMLVMISMRACLVIVPVCRACWVRFENCSGILNLCSQADPDCGLELGPADTTYSDGTDSLGLNDTVEECLLDGGINDVPSSSSQTPPTNSSNTASAESLYPGADITVMQANLLVYLFALKHNLTCKAITELLLLIRLLLPSGNHFCKSLYSLKQYFLQMTDASTNTHNYCSMCHTPLTAEQDICSNNLCEEDTVHQFITMPVGGQLKRLVESKQAMLNLMNSTVYVCLPNMISFPS